MKTWATMAICIMTIGIMLYMWHDNSSNRVKGVNISSITDSTLINWIVTSRKNWSEKYSTNKSFSDSQCEVYIYKNDKSANGFYLYVIGDKMAYYHFRVILQEDKVDIIDMIAANENAIEREALVYIDSPIDPMKLSYHYTRENKTIQLNPIYTG